MHNVVDAEARIQAALALPSDDEDRWIPARELSRRDDAETFELASALAFHADEQRREFGAC